tara:strand:- start:395 stop:604 length:210 start_codon:yes stop_codon:yes gene_type:complete
MAINTFEISGQFGRILGLAGIGVEWLEEIEKLDPDTPISTARVSVTLKSLKENLKKIEKEIDKIDLYGN